MRNDYITRLVQICLDIANIADERGEVDKPYFEELGLGYRALSGILRRGCKEIIDLQNDYHRAIEAKNLAKIGEKEAQPTIQPEPHWHPISEHPEEDDDYLLLTHEKTKYGTFKRIIIGAWNGATKEWLEEYEGMYRDVNHPIAWMSKEELLLLKGWM